MKKMNLILIKILIYSSRTTNPFNSNKENSIIESQILLNLKYNIIK